MGRLVRRLDEALTPLSRVGVLPEYQILGAQRCGTTLLYHYLTTHPAVAAAPTKEIHFFDLNYEKGLSWYRQHFPTSIAKRLDGLRLRRSRITGEASPYYLFHPHVPSRLAATCPAAKLIVLLRNPVDRAYSHYQHEVVRGYERVPFEVALEHEPVRLEREVEKMKRDLRYNSYAHQHYSYLSRGIYVDQLSGWFALFPRKQFLVLKSEDFWADPAGGWARVVDFLALPRIALPEEARRNAHPSPPMNPATRARLTRYFEPHNERLSDLLGEDFRWRS